MLNDKSQTPTRHELLSMVRKHSKSIGNTLSDEDESVDVEMDSKFWHDVIDLYFVGGRDSKGRQDDDLLFFVRKLLQRPTDNVDGNSPYFVRRWAPKLDDLVGDTSVNIDWRRSFYLNLIAHTSFSVTVAICRFFNNIRLAKENLSTSQQVLQQYQAGQGKPLSPIYKVVKKVYASPSRINFHLDSRKEVETTPAYPDICFAVDDFDSTFDAVVLTDTDHCYCVILNAHEGGVFTSENTDRASGSTVSSPEAVANAGKLKNPKITLFSGFVSYQMVREAYDAGRTGFGSLLSLGHSSGKTDRIYMKGPGGRGEVEVAVSGVLDQSKTETGPHSPIQSPKKGMGIGTIVRTAASVASTAAKQAYAAASASAHRPSDGEMLPLKCCLMSISLPWEHIAHDLLFKRSPPVNL